MFRSLRGAKDSLIVTSVGEEAARFDELMGVMPLITPHVEKAVESYRLLLGKAEELNKKHVKGPTLFVEGPSDVAILKRAVAVFAPQYVELIKIVASEAYGGGGAWVSDMLLSAMHGRDSTRIAGIFDYDTSGVQEKDRVIKTPKYEKQDAVRAFSLKAPPHMQKIFHAKLKVSICLEDMVGDASWEHASEMGWLQPRPDLIKQNPVLAENLNRSAMDVLTEYDLRDITLLRILHRISDDHKKNFSKYVEKMDDEVAAVELQAFKAVILSVTTHLVPNN